jgi:hypothetical protein
VNPKYRILIPIGLAVVAAAANFVLLQQATATTGVLVLKGDVPAGQAIQMSDLTVVQVRADPAVIAAAYPAANVTELIGMRFRRPMDAGGLVLKSDVDVEGSNLHLYPGERDGSLLLAASAVPVELSTGEYVEFTLPGLDGRQHGPFRVLGTRPEVNRHGEEKFTRVLFAGADVSGVMRAKGRSSDEFKLAREAQLSRLAKGAGTGQRVNAQPRGGE